MDPKNIEGQKEIIFNNCLIKQDNVTLLKKRTKSFDIPVKGKLPIKDRNVLVKIEVLHFLFMEARTGEK